MSILSGMGAASNPITGALTSVVEGIGELGAAIGHATEGDWAAAGQQFAGVAMEAAGIAGTALGFPASEAVFEGLESVLTETGVLDEGSPGVGGLIPGPGGEAGGGSAAVGAVGNLLSGGGASPFGGGAAALGPLGGAGDVLSMFSGGGQGGGIGDVLMGTFGGEQGSAMVETLGSIGDGVGMMNQLQNGASAVDDDLISSFLGSIGG